MDFGNAILSLCPTAKFILRGETYDGLEWLDETIEKPTEEQLIAEYEKLQAQYIATQYQRDRAKEYPSFADQFDLLYHGGYETWKEAINVIKEKYPKPE